MPCRVTAIPRPLPLSERAWWGKGRGWGVLSLIGGILPFGAIFTELYFVLEAVVEGERAGITWELLLFVFLVYCVTCGLVSVALTYCTLVVEDYRWWFRSFVVCASSGVYVFVWGVLFFETKGQNAKFAGEFLYLVYLGLLSGFVGLVGGFAGFAVTFAFVRKIYASIKVD